MTKAHIHRQVSLFIGSLAIAIKSLSHRQGRKRLPWYHLGSATQASPHSIGCNGPTRIDLVVGQDVILPHVLQSTPERRSALLADEGSQPVTLNFWRQRRHLPYGQPRAYSSRSTSCSSVVSADYRQSRGSCQLAAENLLQPRNTSQTRPGGQSQSDGFARPRSDEELPNGHPDHARDQAAHIEDRIGDRAQ